MYGKHTFFNNIITATVGNLIEERSGAQTLDHSFHTLDVELVIFFQTFKNVICRCDPAFSAQKRPD